MKTRATIGLVFTLAVLTLVGFVVYQTAHTFASVLEAKTETLRIQGDIITALIAANATINTDRIALDPDRLLEGQSDDSPINKDVFSTLEFAISPERVALILRHLLRASHTRARVYARDGTLMVDSEQQRGPGSLSVDAALDQPVDKNVKGARSRWMAFLMRGDIPVYRDIGTANGTAYPELRSALGGSPSTMLLINEHGDVTLSMALPIQYEQSIQGVLLISTRIWS